MSAKLTPLPCPVCGAAVCVSERLQHSPGDTGWFRIECMVASCCMSRDNLPSSLNGRKDSAIREWNRLVRAEQSGVARP